MIYAYHTVTMNDFKSLKVLCFKGGGYLIKQLKFEKDELFEKIKLETQKKLNSQLENERKKIYKFIQDQNELKLKEKKTTGGSSSKASRKQTQGGIGKPTESERKVQELAIESWITTYFPFDTIDEIIKGVKGADCI